MSNVKEGVMAGPFSRPPWPNRLAPNVQAIVSPTGAARKNSTWANFVKLHPELAKILKEKHPELSLTPGKLRPTFDAAAPHGLLEAFGVNMRQRGRRVQMPYRSASSFAALVLLAGPGAFFIAFDVKAAYKTFLKLRRQVL
jgi:hypothetical protein